MKTNFRKLLLPKGRFISLAVFIVVSLAFSIILWQRRSPSIDEVLKKHEGSITVPLSPLEIKVLKEDLNKKVKELGLEKTYAYLVANYPQSGSTTVAHAVTHYFGELTYDQLGLGGIKICGYKFPAGCYHGLMTRAIEKEGFENTIDRLIDFCKEAQDVKDGCIHFLGHIFLGHFGNNQITKALEKCSKLDTDLNPKPCFSGVFMDYYLPFVYHETSGEQVRKFDKNTPYDICLSLERDEFQKSCILYLVDWWTLVLKGDYREIARLCDNLEDNGIKEVCYASIGAISADTLNYDIESIKNTCSLLKLSDQQILCLSGALKTFTENGKMKEDGAKLLCPTNTNSCVSLSKSVL